MFKRSSGTRDRVRFHGFNRSFSGLLILASRISSSTDLYFRQLQRVRYVRAFRQAQVLLRVELALQLQQLFRGEGGASSAGLVAAGARR